MFYYFRAEKEDCSNFPCKNNATCTDHVNSYSCMCATGFTGKACETGLTIILTSKFQIILICIFCSGNFFVVRLHLHHILQGEAFLTGWYIYETSLLIFQQKLTNVQVHLVKTTDHAATT